MLLGVTEVQTVAVSKFRELIFTRYREILRVYSFLTYVRYNVIMFFSTQLILERLTYCNEAWYKHHAARDLSVY